MDYIISQSEKDLLKLNIVFTPKDAEILIEYWETINNFIWVTQAWYRSNLALWLAKWEEEKIYSYVECLEDLKNQISNIWTKMKEYKMKQQKDLQNKEKE